MARSRAFTLIELLAVLAIVVFFVALLLPSTSGSRRTARRMQNNTQVRGIHQSLVMFAQGNKLYFPGLNKDGTDGPLAVEDRFHTLLAGNYFTGEYAVNPSETLTAWTTGPLTSTQYSYAMLQIPPQGSRRAEWSETLNTDAIALSDRNTGTAAAPTSVYSGQPIPGSRGWTCVSRRHPNTWLGSVAYNDNHVVYESTHVLATKYGPGGSRPATDPARGAAAVTNPNDHLFDAPTENDALMVHSGN